MSGSFQSGLVVVNPTLSKATVKFDAAYSGSGLNRATEATLAPHSGLVLVRSDSPAAASIARAGLRGPGGASGVRHGRLRLDRRHRRHHRHRHHHRRHSRRHLAKRS